MSDTKLQETRGSVHVMTDERLGDLLAEYRDRVACCASEEYAIDVIRECAAEIYRLKAELRSPQGGNGGEGMTDHNDAKPTNARADAERWLNGEISLGRFIHNSSLESCYAQASDFAGGIANEFSAKLASAAHEIDRLKAELAEAQAERDAARCENVKYDLAYKTAKARIMVLEGRLDVATEGKV